MKRTPLFLTGVALLTALALTGWKLGWWSPDNPAPPPPDVRTTTADGSTLTSTSDPAAVFQKAFWRRPGPDDTIIHAERREWSTPTDGVQRWQWFIAVRPGPAMKEWIATNPFNLSPPSSSANAKLPAPPPGSSPRPTWFPDNLQAYQIQSANQGNLLWLHGDTANILYATDAGEGFTPAAR